MFAWLRNLFHKQPEAHGVFKPKELFIYSYFNGSEQVREDPVMLYQRLLGVWGELCVDMQIIHSEVNSPTLLSPQMRLEAKILAAEKVRKVFNVKPLKEGGLDTDTTLELFYHFYNWSESLKKDTEPSVMSVKDGSKPMLVSPTEESAIPTSLDSGSTENGNSTDRRMPLLSESVLPTIS